MWKTTSSKLVYQNRYMRVYHDHVVTNHGDKIEYGILRKKPAVWIVAMKQGKILFVNNYRHVINRSSWEIPAGHAEELTPTVAARKELEEETGYRAKDLKLIGEFYIAPGHSDQIAYAYLTTKLATGKQSLEPTEKKY